MPISESLYEPARFTAQSLLAGLRPRFADGWLSQPGRKDDLCAGEPGNNSKAVVTRVARKRLGARALRPSVPGRCAAEFSMNDQQVCQSTCGTDNVSRVLIPHTAAKAPPANSKAIALGSGIG